VARLAPINARKASGRRAVACLLVAVIGIA
jgi:hypothetical protein